MEEINTPSPIPQKKTVSTRILWIGVVILVVSSGGYLVQKMKGVSESSLFQETDSEAEESSVVTQSTLGIQATGTIADLTATYPYIYSAAMMDESLQRCPIKDTDSARVGIDNETYRRLIFTLLPNNPKETVFLCPAIQSLQVLDIEGDGREEILGFVHIENDVQATSTTLMLWRYNMSRVAPFRMNDPDAVLFRRESLFSFEIYDTDTHSIQSPCKLMDVLPEKIGVQCADSTGDYHYTLRMQDGAYVQESQPPVVFKGAAGWREFSNERWGVRFQYPPDIQISEETYKDPEERIVSILQAKRNGKSVFEILDVVPNEHMGARDDVLLRLADGTYLTRESMRLSKQSLQYRSGVFYFKAGSSTVLAHGMYRPYRETFGPYLLFSSLTDERALREVDQIFASLRLVATSSSATSAPVPVPENLISLGNHVTVKVPGFLQEQEVSEYTLQQTPTALERKSFKIYDVPSGVWVYTHLSMRVHPFGSVGTTSNIWNGAYDAVKDTCVSSERGRSAPEDMGGYRVCSYGYGDAGEITRGYYILDPKREYILTLSFDNSMNAGRFSGKYLTDADIEAIIASVRFTPNGM